MGDCLCYFVNLRVLLLTILGPSFDHLGGKAYIIISTKISGGKPLFLLVAAFLLRLTTIYHPKRSSEVHLWGIYLGALV